MKTVLLILGLAVLLSLGLNLYQYFGRAVAGAYTTERIEALERDLTIFCGLANWNLTSEEILEAFGTERFPNELEDGNYQFLINGGYFILDSQKRPIKFHQYHLGTLQITEGKVNC